MLTLNHSYYRVAVSYCVILLFALPLQAQTTFTVTNTSDSGNGSLRQAIEDANANPGADEIHFAIPGAGPHTIAPAPGLPIIDDPVVIDGYTQPGATENTNAAGGLNTVLMIELAGTSADFNGLHLAADNSTVRGLAINGFPDSGIFIGDVAGNIVEGCFLGTAVTGMAAAPNGASGVFVFGGTDNVIGGLEPGARNLVSGNSFHGVTLFSDAARNRVEGNLIGTDVTGTISLGSVFFGVNLSDGADDNVIGGTAPNAGNVISGNNSWGVAIHNASHNNRVEGNFIGTDALGLVPVPNASDGVRIEEGSTGNIIGGTDPAARNIISGNVGDGVEINGSGASANRVEGNYIGTDWTGLAPLGNGASGVEIDDANGNTVGGAAAGAGNLISGNDDDGIFIRGAASTGNIIQGNLIGTQANGTSPLGNADDGVDFSSSFPASNNTIGGTAPGQGNVIAFNGRRGVALTGGTGNRVLSNSIFSNTNLGIDLLGGNEDAFLVTANDAGDNDIGPNDLQNYPTLTTAVLGSLTVDGAFNGRSNRTLRLEFFANDACDISGSGEGHTFVGAWDITTDGNGDAVFTASFPDATVPAGAFITATASDANGNSSEFSACLEVNQAPIAQDDERMTPEETIIDIEVLANDSDADGDALTVTVIAQPTDGTADVLGDQRIRYTPDQGFNGNEVFTYQVDDGRGGLDEATVVVQVGTTNSPPTASEITSPEDASVVIVGGAPGSNPLDPETVLIVEWTEATDSDGDAISYIWEMSTSDDFAVVLLSAETGTATQFETTLGVLAGLLDAAGVTPGNSTIFFHRVNTSDGTATTDGSASTMTLERGTLTHTESRNEIPSQITLEAAYPNPFNLRTVLPFTLPSKTEVRLSVHDVLGREIAVLIDSVLPAGQHKPTFEAGELPNGLYIYQLETDGVRQVRQVLLVK